MFIPRPEHPRPQFQRKTWLNLNGLWEFEIDNEKSCSEKGILSKKKLDKEIIVPFCPESKLSGIEHTDFMHCVWYAKDFEMPEQWHKNRILLHFGAVDYKTQIWINGEYVGQHTGGYTSFYFDITDKLHQHNRIMIRVEDDVRSADQPSGKQSQSFLSSGCMYTRTTGIWQTVWLEAVGQNYLKNIKLYPDIQNTGIGINLFPYKVINNCICRLTAYYHEKCVGRAEVTLSSTSPYVYISLTEKHLWELGQGRLYDLKLELIENEQVIDTVYSYFGLRDIALDDKAFYLNGKKIFGRWVLDQGYYPEGIYTAPSDEALKNDILYGLQLGFNGARLHEKVFEERYLYHADKIGYMVWGEYPNWGYFATQENVNIYANEWIEAIQRDFNHPSIIGWCPFNETWEKDDGTMQSKSTIELIYKITKIMDHSRPVIDTSGNYHTTTDIFDVHDYEQNPEIFTRNYEQAANKIVLDQIERTNRRIHQKYTGGPLFISEYGGIQWNTNGNSGWGYGDAPKTEEEFLRRYKELTNSLLQNENIMGFCYTQLYDIEQEINGLMTYNRIFKFKPEMIRQINIQKAAIEE